MCEQCSGDPEIRRLRETAARRYDKDIQFRTLTNLVGAYMAQTGADLKLIAIAAQEVARVIRQKSSTTESDLAERLRFKEFADHERQMLQMEGFEEGQAYVLEVVNNVIVGSGGVRLDEHVVAYLEDQGFTVPAEFVKG